MVLRYYRMPVNMGRLFNYPVFFFLLFKTALIANKVLYLVVLIETGCNLNHLVAFHPQCCFAAAFFAIAVGIHRLGVPYTAPKTGSSVGKRAYRAHIYYVARKILIHYILNVSGYFRYIATVHYTMHA